MECPLEHVSFATFELEGETDIGWTIAERMLEGKSGELVTWEAFVVAFREKYFLVAVREQKEIEFIGLTQGNLIVA